MSTVYIADIGLVESKSVRVEHRQKMLPYEVELFF
jgi:hypothetical protein